MDPEVFVVRDVNDVKRIREEGSPRKIHFEIHEQSPSSCFGAIAAVLKDTIASDANVQEVQIRGGFFGDTNCFLTTISNLPNLKTFKWIASRATTADDDQHGTGLPIQYLSRILWGGCRSLESMSLEGLHCTATPDMLSYLYTILKHCASLKFFQCVHCQVEDAEGESFTEVWVDEMLNSLSHVPSLECIDIRVAPHADNQGRALLGLCKDGACADAATERLNVILQQDLPSIPYQKVRLWIADTYQRRDSPRLLLYLCENLSHNTWVEDYRVRASDDIAATFVTKAVIKGHNELFESGQNVTLLRCDLMGRQSGEVDLYCRLNGMGRGALLQQMDTMSRGDWLERIIMIFSTDLDALNYWLRLQPVFISSFTAKTTI